PQKLNMWAYFCECGITGSFFIEGYLNANTYLDLLRNQIVSAIDDFFDGNIQNIWFQQDGAPPHYAVVVRQFLPESFP
ncbi:hypothetical protein EAI_04185, partial [Harpegnathos saltator]